MEKWVKELKNDLSKKVADVEVVRHDLDKVRNSLKRQDNKVHSFTSHIISLKTKWDDLIFVKASLEQRKSALSSEKAKMEVAIEKLGSESFWNGVLHVEHFCGVQVDNNLLDPICVVGENGLVAPKGSLDALVPSGEPCQTSTHGELGDKPGSFPYVSKDDNHSLAKDVDFIMTDSG